MTTKTEKINELKSKFEKVGTPVLVNKNDDMALKQYDIPVIEKITGGGRTIPITVINEDQAGESCMCPVLDSDTTWEDVVKTKIQDAINAGQIIKGVVQSINAEYKFAIVDVYTTNNSDVSKAAKFIYEDKDSNIQVKNYNG